MHGMTEDPLSAEAEASICPWCSASYNGEPETCPSCGAVLAADPTTDPSLPGLTSIDTAAIVRAKTPSPRSRNRILSWISGEYPDEPGTVADAGALAPPDLAVRREILRLELEAEVANLQAEADALIAEATVEGHAPGVSAEDAAAAEAVVEKIEEVSHELHVVDEELGTEDLGAITPVANEAATHPEPATPEQAAPPPADASGAADEASPPA
jgi:hypothetical protein